VLTTVHEHRASHSLLVTKLRCILAAIVHRFPRSGATRLCKERFIYPS
jgi:hypothetical protein